MVLTLEHRCGPPSELQKVIMMAGLLTEKSWVHRNASAWDLVSVMKLLDWCWELQNALVSDFPMECYWEFATGA